MLLPSSLHQLSNDSSRMTIWVIIHIIIVEAMFRCLTHCCLESYLGSPCMFLNVSLALGFSLYSQWLALSRYLLLCSPFLFSYHSNTSFSHDLGPPILAWSPYYRNLLRRYFLFPLHRGIHKCLSYVPPVTKLFRVCGL